MPITGTESKAELRAECAEKSKRADELLQRYQREEATPDEVDEMKCLGQEIKALEDAIRDFPEPEGVREQVNATKSFLRARATQPPPSAGQHARGDGGSLKSAEHGGGGSPFSAHANFGVHIKTLGELLVEEMERDRASGRKGWEAGVGNQAWAREFKGLYQLNGVGVDNDTLEAEGEAAIKAALTSTTATLTSYDRRPGIVDVRQQRLTIADLLAQGTTDGPTIRYVRETSYTNAATSVAEGGEKPEASLALEEVDAPIRKAAVWTKVSEEMLADYNQIRSFVDGRLRFMVLQREEALLLNGNGTAPNIRGILQTSGIQTQAQSTGLTAADAIHMAITKIQAVGNDEPDGIVVHPTDWQHLRLAKDANGQYIAGGPFWTPYAGSGGYVQVRTLWGLRVVVTTAISAGTALVGNFGTGDPGAQMFRRSGVTVQMTNTDQDDFIKNLVTVRAEGRIGLAVYRPLSFATVTSLSAGVAA